MLLTLCAAVLGQVEPEHPAFEAASIRQAVGGGTQSLGPGTVRLVQMSLRLLLKMAYDIRTYQQISGPGWLADDRFDITAKIPEGAASDQIPQMLQSLLEERFKVRIHWETKPLPAYALLLGKNGAKFVEARPDAPPGIRVEMGPAPGFQTTGFKGAVTMERFAQLLSNMSGMDRPVIDMTELQGKYDIDVSFTPLPVTTAVAGDSDAPQQGSIFSVFSEKLGLKLEARKLPLKVLVVDHAERAPTDN